MQVNEEILQQLKKGMFLTRIIPEPILRSLMYLPFAVFDNVKQVKIDYDLNFDDPNLSYVKYIITFKEGESKELPEEKSEYVIKATKQLLWNEVKVEIAAEDGNV